MTEQEQRKQHDEDLAQRIVEFIIAEDLDRVGHDVTFYRDRMAGRIIAAMDLARQHERVIMSDSIIQAIEEVQKATRWLNAKGNGAQIHFRRPPLPCLAIRRHDGGIESFERHDDRRQPRRSALQSSSKNGRP